MVPNATNSSSLRLHSNVNVFLQNPGFPSQRNLCESCCKCEVVLACCAGLLGPFSIKFLDSGAQIAGTVNTQSMSLALNGPVRLRSEARICGRR